MLTPAEEARWTKMLKATREYVSIKWGTGGEDDDLRTVHNFYLSDKRTIIAVDLELTALRTALATTRETLVAAQTALAYEGVRVAAVDAVVGTEGLPSWMKDDAAFGKEESESC